MAGEATQFARQDYVEEAWRIVDPVLQAVTPVQQYEPGTWGPSDMAEVTPPGGWHDPIAAEPVAYDQPVSCLIPEKAYPGLKPVRKAAWFAGLKACAPSTRLRCPRWASNESGLRADYQFGRRRSPRAMRWQMSCTSRSMCCQNLPNPLHR